jgi:hypothetical protein
MKLDNYKPVDPQGVPGSPAWLELALKPINSQIALLTTCLQGRVSAENKNEEMRDLEMTHGIPKLVTLQTLRGAPRGAFAIQCAAKGAIPLVAMTILDEKQVELLPHFLGTVPTAAVSVRVVFIGS